MPTIMKRVEVKRERTSVPTPKEFEVGDNPSYLNSLMTGCVSPLLHLPQILWFNSLWPFVKSLGGSVAFIGMAFVAGVTGKANGYRVLSVEERELTMDEKEEMVRDILSGTGFVPQRLDKPSATDDKQQ
jgi:hypothetical protein